MTGSGIVDQAALGIDLGGTNLQMALVSAAGEVLASRAHADSQSLRPDDFIGLVAETLRDLRGDGAPVGIGVGIAGTVFEGGELRPEMTNLPKLTGVRLADGIEAATGLPCLAENDAGAAMRGEACFGAAVGRRNAACLTLGTGIGSGLLLDGRIREGAHGNGGEIGITLLTSDQADWVVLEEVASPGGLLRQTGESAESLVRAAAAGDTAAAARLERMYRLLGLTIVNLHLLLDLEVVVLCGGITQVGAPLIDGVRRAFAAACPVPYHFGLHIALSEQGPWAGAIGAACLGFESAGVTP